MTETDHAPATPVRRFWEAMEARDWLAAGHLLAADVVARWPASGERFAGSAAVIAVNRDYPGDWHIVVDEVLANGPRVVARVTVTLGGVPETCIGFYDIEGDRISTMDEWWVTRYAAPDRGAAAMRTETSDVRP